MAKRVGYVLLGFLAVVSGLLGFTARTRYELPKAQAAQHFAEFVPTVPRRDGDATVVLFVFDGFGPTIVRAAKTPNLDRIRQSGAYTLDLMPAFPSLSMPNHFSLSTGCYPEHHGIVSNHFRDPRRGVFDQKGDADWLLACQPLHVVAEAQGVRAAVFGHVAATSTAHGKLATIAEPYIEPPPSAAAQADRIIEQLARPIGERPRLITAYVTEPDSTAHRYGPTAPETLKMAAELDVQIGRVMAQIERMPANERTTLIVTSDHGMAAANQFVSVERLLRRAGVEATVFAEGALAHVYLDQPSSKPLALAALGQFEFVSVIDPQHAPAPLHITGTGPAQARYGDLLVALHAGAWTADSAFFPWHLRWLNFVGKGIAPSDRFKGMHGQDPEAVPELRAIFYAWGNAITPRAIEDMRNVDVHPTVALLLGIQPGTPIDGKARVEILRPGGPDPAVNPTN
jgi:arylsulfatase A-like enzyme